MRVHLATVGRIADHVYRVERTWKTDHLILFTAKEDYEKDEETQKNLEEIRKTMEKLGITTEIQPISFMSFEKNISKFVKTIHKFRTADHVLLNLSGSRRSISIGLFSAAVIARAFGVSATMSCVIAAENMDTLLEFPLLPSYLPDEIDRVLLANVEKIQRIHDLGAMAGIKQPTASQRLKKLSEHGYIVVSGRKRQLTPLGRMIVNINEELQQMST